MDHKFILSIPARLESSRLPNKVLEEINGKPMLLRVLEQCSKLIDKSKIVLCTDSDKIINLAKNYWNYEVIKTSKDCNSGSERIASIIDKLVKKIWSITDNDGLIISDEIYRKTLVINVQGDQPFLNPNVIKTMIDKCLSMDSIPDVITPIYKLSKEQYS